MKNKILSLVMTAVLVMAQALPVCAAEPETPQVRTIAIMTVKGLEKLAEDCRLDSYSEHLVVSLLTDLDLTDSDFQGIPIFCGKFEGNGHKIRGLNVTREGSSQGFFRYLTKSAEVQDLHLEGSVQITGSASAVGGFVGKNSGLITGCSFTGTVSGKEHIGGIAGENTVIGVIDDCFVSGTVFGDHFVGGIAGKNTGTIRHCENRALINETPRQNKVELSDITMNSVIHSEAANTVTDVGGIAGNSTGMIHDCINKAKIGYLSMGYNIGGITGTQSGTILNCENRAEVFGRKEVGGIVGHMEPSAVMEFEEDVLQILERQLNGMSRQVSKASSNLQGAGEDILYQMDGMYDYILDAKDAVDTLISDSEEMGWPDEDALQAARNSIGSSLVGMTEVMEDVSATAYTALGIVSSNLYDIFDQINAMRTTLGNISETTGGSIVDLSDEDTRDDLSGKVAYCRNTGNIHGDLNCGGIAGAMALENDLDVQEDWQIKGENSLNFESELRAVIRDCENTGIISAGKQNAGGIVGLQTLGLVKDSTNAGLLDAEKADYVGGISGHSTGFIRSSHANGELFGNQYVGGIAGSATIATDCYALVRIIGGTEKLGMVLGSREENQREIEDPIAGNYYLPAEADTGAIDGISYEGQAQPLKEEVFFALDNLPDMFRHVVVTFRFENGFQQKFTVNFGTAFPEEKIPAIPAKENRQAYWDGLEEADLSKVYFNMVFEPAFTTQITVLESQVTRNNLPLLFVQGIFSENTQLTVEALEQEIPVNDSEALLEVWQFRTDEPEQQRQIRLLLPEGTNEEEIRILIRGKDRTWREEAHHVLGRYTVASLLPGDDAIALVQIGSLKPLLLGGACAALAVLVGILILRKRKKKA